MPQQEDVTLTYVTIIGTLAGVFADSANVILLSLTFAAALKALPSLYTRRSSGDLPGFVYIEAEDWIFFLASIAGYLLTAGSGDARYAIVGLAVATIGKSFPSLYRHRRFGRDSDQAYNQVEDQLMLVIALVSILLAAATSHLSYATYGLAFAFVVKGLGSFEP